MAPAYIGLIAGVVLVSISNKRLKKQLREKNNVKIEPLNKFEFVDNDFKDIKVENEVIEKKK